MKYIAIDSGKYNTKVASLDKEKEVFRKFRFRTKYEAGNLLDDNIGKCTFLVGYDNKAYKIGNAAKNEAELNTSKQSEIHKICTLTAIAMCVSKENEEVAVAIGIPVSEYQLFETREAYKNYILPDGKITMSLKTDEESPVKQVSFTIKKKYVFPESSGALYVNVKEAQNTAAVIDIGNLNINCTYWENFTLDETYTITDELGGDILITNLAQDLSAEFSRVDKNVVAKLLQNPPEKRYLMPIKKNPDIEQRSKELITQRLLEHVNLIKRRCDGKRWPLDYLKLIFIGGTSHLLKNEIKQVFGEDVIIPQEPEYINVIGFLRRLCSKDKIDVMHYINKDISYEKKENAKAS